jgi:hypothetical protein
MVCSFSKRLFFSNPVQTGCACYNARHSGVFLFPEGRTTFFKKVPEIIWSAFYCSNYFSDYPLIAISMNSAVANPLFSINAMVFLKAKSLSEKPPAPFLQQLRMLRRA